MENVSQALLIVGGILLAIITLSLLTLLFTNASQIGTAQAEEQETKQLLEWNSEWEAYNKQLMYGAEVLTVINKAEQNNFDYDNSTQYRVTVTVYGKDGSELTKDDVKNQKTKIFECTRIKINPDTGRVNEIDFKYKE